jgi:SAM-dependent methyltransferase
MPEMPVVSQEKAQSQGCNACGDMGLPVPRMREVRDPQSTERFAIVRCPACGVARTSPEPEDLARYYGAAYYGGRYGFTARYSFARRVRLLRKAAPTRGNLLDIGCGDGGFLLAANADGWSVAGTEIGQAAEISRKNGIDVRGAVNEMKGRAPFDAITMWHTLEHFRNPRAILGEARERLAHQGTFIVAVPDAEGLQARLFREKWFHLDVPRHLYHFDQASLEGLLRKTGFTVARWHHLELEHDLFGWLQSALNAMMPEPNVLFQSLTGKPRTAGTGQLALSYALGTVLGPVALAATAVGALARRSATMIAIARPA